MTEQQKQLEEERVKLPDGFRIEQARNYMRMHINRATVMYDLPGEIIDLVLEGLLAEERGQRIALMTEQTDYIVNDMNKKLKERGTGEKTER
jgi:hypothetical protein